MLNPILVMQLLISVGELNCGRKVHRNTICILQAFLIYAAGFYSNMGNYKSFGDTKFVPNVAQV